MCSDLDGLEEIVKVFTKKGAEPTIYRMDAEGGKQAIDVFFASYHGIDNSSVKWTKGKKEYGQGGNQPVYKGALIINAINPDILLLSYSNTLYKNTTSGCKDCEIKAGKKSSVDIVVEGITSKDAQMVAFRRTMVNYVTGALLPFGIIAFGTEVAGAEYLSASFTGASIVLDADELAGGLINEDSAIETVLPDEGKVALNVFKAVVDMTGKTADLKDIANTEKKLEVLEKSTTAAKGTLDVIDDIESSIPDADESKY